MPQLYLGYTQTVQKSPWEPYLAVKLHGGVARLASDAATVLLADHQKYDFSAPGTDTLVTDTKKYTFLISQTYSALLCMQTIAIY